MGGGLSCNCIIFAFRVTGLREFLVCDFLLVDHSLRLPLPHKTYSGGGGGDVVTSQAGLMGPNNKSDNYDDSDYGIHAAGMLFTKLGVDAARECCFPEVGISVKLVRKSDILQHGSVTRGLPDCIMRPAAAFVNYVFIRSVV